MTKLTNRELDARLKQADTEGKTHYSLNRYFGQDDADTTAESAVKKAFIADSGNDQFRFNFDK